MKQCVKNASTWSYVPRFSTVSDIHHTKWPIWLISPPDTSHCCLMYLWRDQPNEISAWCLQPRQRFKKNIQNKLFWLVATKLKIIPYFSYVTQEIPDQSSCPIRQIAPLLCSSVQFSWVLVLDTQAKWYLGSGHVHTYLTSLRQIFLYVDCNRVIFL